MKTRIKFSKEGNLRFVGHLDMMRYFQKANRRAELPVAYSESHPIPDPESYAVADSDDAAPAVGVSCTIYDAGARADTRGDDAGRRWSSGSRARRGAEAGEHVLSQLQEGEGVGCGPLAPGRSWIP